MATAGQQLSLPQRPLRTKVALGRSPGCHQVNMGGSAHKSLPGAESWSSFLFLRWATSVGSGPNSPQSPFPPVHIEMSVRKPSP